MLRYFLKWLYWRRVALAQWLAPAEWRVAPDGCPFMNGFDAATMYLLSEMHAKRDADGKALNAAAEWMDGYADGIVK